MNISAFLDQQLVSRSSQTKKAYQSDLLKFRGFLEEQKNEITGLAGIKPEQVTPAHISAFVKSLKSHRNYRTKRKGLSESTIQRHIASVRAYYSWLQYYSPDMRNPTVMFHSRRESGERKVPGIKTEVIEAMCRESQQARDVAIVKLFHRSGIRLSELISLNRNTLKIMPACGGAPRHAQAKVFGKGKKQRTVLISDDALDAICDYLDERTDKNPALFLSSRGRRISMRTVQRIIARLAVMAGAEHAHPHQLRHSYGGDMINNGVELLVLQKLLGHEDPKTTMRYSEAEKRNASRQYHAAMENLHAKESKMESIAHRAPAKAA